MTQVHYGLLATALVGLITAVFWVTPLDIYIASQFYDPENLSDPWPEDNKPLWSFFYELGPILSMVIALGSIFFMLIAGLKRQWHHFRVKALFILLCFLVGPGLIVNALLKDNWGRPRPNDIQVFAGSEPYAPPLKYVADNNGKSFPSGHASVGFAFFAFFFLWHKTRKRLAYLALANAVLLGSLLGATRIIGGGHFLSDIFWAMVICFATSWGIYRLMEKPLTSGKLIQAKAVMAGLAAIVLAFGLFNIPVERQETVQLETKAYQTLQMTADPLFVTVITHTDETIEIQHTIKGFGLPWSRIAIEQTNHTNNDLELVAKRKGYFTELKGKMIIKVPERLKGHWIIHSKRWNEDGTRK